ncbi:hypothetical protein BGZ65_004129 [Modicella reniformis]|uniref:Uncharacterized protein n=1 Tax=Modicella reniformis TaxID=1440133 RepID=A0A9P6M902_9FUNG|nr:hypothetical protein BGZ65_004129 [Modicella reniformis]
MRLEPDPRLFIVAVGTYNDPTKKRGPPKGYIEAIEARLYRMEGFLDGLIKDKDPRAEIVRAELDAMAREAEMTGLQLRRSKAYEEINHVKTSKRFPLEHNGALMTHFSPLISSLISFIDYYRRLTYASVVVLDLADVI